MKPTMSRRGGFPSAQFCNQFKSEFFNCLICLDVCRSPVTCRSGAHLFCHGCLAESLRHNPSCPTCREPLADPVLCPFASKQVSALDVFCSHDECTWKGTCGRLDSHLDNDCPYEPIECTGEGGCGARALRREMATHRQFICLQNCPNSKAEESIEEEFDTCDVRLSRNDLIDHLQNHCELRLIHCPHPSCEFSAAYNRMPAHLEVCPLAPVLCPRQCDTPNLTRQCLDAHKTDCPNEPVLCVHAPLGCSHVAPRGQIGEHEQDIGVHFVALSKAFVQLQQSHVRLKQSHVQLQRSHVQLQQPHVQLQQSHVQLQRSVETKLEAQATLLQPLVAEAQARAEAKARAKAKARTKARAKARAKAKARAEAQAKAKDEESDLEWY
ncbi:hypothetical protein EMCRGX_G004233 [Ephydatia muelleri]